MARHCAFSGSGTSGNKVNVWKVTTFLLLLLIVNIYITGPFLGDNKFNMTYSIAKFHFVDVNEQPI